MITRIIDEQAHYLFITYFKIVSGKQAVLGVKVISGKQGVLALKMISENQVVLYW